MSSPCLNRGTSVRFHRILFRTAPSLQVGLPDPACSEKGVAFDNNRVYNNKIYIVFLVRQVSSLEFKGG